MINFVNRSSLTRSLKWVFSPIILNQIKSNQIKYENYPQLNHKTYVHGFLQREGNSVKINIKNYTQPVTHKADVQFMKQLTVGLVSVQYAMHLFTCVHSKRCQQKDSRTRHLQQPME